MASWSPARDVLRLGTAITVAVLLPVRVWGHPLEMLTAAAAGAAVGRLIYLALRTGARGVWHEWPERRRWPGFLATVFAWAAFEELVWRGLAFQVLLEYIPVPAAILVSAGGFALLHYESQGLKGIVVHLLTGTAFAAAVFLTGSIVASIAAHFTYNLFALTGRSAPSRSRLVPGDTQP